MKIDKILILLMVVIFGFVSCTDDEIDYTPVVHDATAKVELLAVNVDCNALVFSFKSDQDGLFKYMVSKDTVAPTNLSVLTNGKSYNVLTDTVYNDTISELDVASTYFVYSVLQNGGKVVSPVVSLKMTTTDTLKPVISFAIVAKSKNVSTKDPIVFTFDENVTYNEDMLIQIDFNGVLPVYDIPKDSIIVEGNKVTIKHPEFRSYTYIILMVPEGAFVDESGNKSEPVAKFQYYYSTGLDYTSADMLGSYVVTFTSTVDKFGLFVDKDTVTLSPIADKNWSYNASGLFKAYDLVKSKGGITDIVINLKDGLDISFEDNFTNLYWEEGQTLVTDTVTNNMINIISGVEKTTFNIYDKSTFTLPVILYVPENQASPGVVGTGVLTFVKLEE